MRRLGLLGAVMLALGLTACPAVTAIAPFVPPVVGGGASLSVRALEDGLRELAFRASPEGAEDRRLGIYADDGASLRVNDAGCSRLIEAGTVLGLGCALGAVPASKAYVLVVRGVGPLRAAATYRKPGSRIPYVVTAGFADVVSPPARRVWPLAFERR